METEERARAGVFLAFQYPVEIPGVSNMEFLKASVDAVREHRGEALDSVTFMKRAREACKSREPASLPQARRQRGFFRRREKAQRTDPDAAPGARLAVSMKPIAVLTSTRCRSLPRA
jgi:hypothetical protein